MPPQHKKGQPISPGVMHRCATLVGLGLSYREAGGAVGISDRTVERVVGRPEYRKVVDEERRKRDGLTAQASSVVTELLNATDKDGRPDLLKRKMGAELVVKNPELLASVEMTDEDAALLPGVILRFPLPADVGVGRGVPLRDGGPGARRKGQSHPDDEIANDGGVPADEGDELASEGSPVSDDSVARNVDSADEQEAGGLSFSDADLEPITDP